MNPQAAWALVQSGMAPGETLWHLAWGSALVPVKLRVSLKWESLGPPALGVVGALALGAVPGLSLLDAVASFAPGPPAVPDLELTVLALSSQRLIVLGTQWFHTVGQGWQVRVSTNATWTPEALARAPLSVEKHGWFGNWRLLVGEGDAQTQSVLSAFHFAPANKDQVEAIARRIADLRGGRPAPRG